VAKLDWQQPTGVGQLPWIARVATLTLFVQPWYGDGIKYRGIVKHPEWTLTLDAQFTDLQLAMRAMEQWAERLQGLEGAAMVAKPA